MPILMRCLWPLVVVTALLAPLSAAACDVPGNLAAVRAELIRDINAQRAGNGMAALAPSPQLAEAAQKHACDNAGHNKMSHAGSDGSRFGARIRRAGYSYGKANENVGYGMTRNPSASRASRYPSQTSRVEKLAEPETSNTFAIATNASDYGPR